jgi:hypothetical protein
VLAAFLCEDFIEGKDGLITAIKIMDRIEVDPTTWKDAKGRRVVTQGKGLIVVRGAPEGESVSVGIHGRSPSGYDVFNSSFSGEPSGPHSGLNMMFHLPLDVTEPGVYWYDVDVQGRFTTRFSLFVDHVVGQGTASSLGAADDEEDEQ